MVIKTKLTVTKMNMFPSMRVKIDLMINEKEIWGKKTERRRFVHFVCMTWCKFIRAIKHSGGFYFGPTVHPFFIISQNELTRKPCLI